MKFTVASDLNRNGMGLEVVIEDDLVIEVFFNEDTCQYTVQTFGRAVPLEVLEQAIAMARLRLPPSSDRMEPKAAP